jgi:uridine phosphorylase
MSLQHHIQLGPEDVGRYVLLPGDLSRCELIAAQFDEPRLVAQNREYITFSGTILGEKVSVTSTGIGNPSAAIAIEELIAIGADTFIRVGSSGGMQKYQRPGDLAIISASIRDEGTTKHYLPVEFPAVANLDVVLALREAAQKLGNPYHLGISHSKDSFYGQIAPEKMPVANYLKKRWQAWISGGAICAEMESATLFVLCSVYQKRAGSITLIAANQESDDPDSGISTEPARLIATAIEAIKILIRNDISKKNITNNHRQYLNLKGSE